MDAKKELEKLQSEFSDCQKILTALGDETRQHLFSIMMMEKCGGSRVVDIATKTNLSRPAVSHHMQILKEAGIVTSRKDGTKIYYMLNPSFDCMHKMSILFSHIESLIKYDESERNKIENDYNWNNSEWQDRI